eukprot:362380-Chlamydomonas_euryale.AAC.4
MACAGAICTCDGRDQDKAGLLCACSPPPSQCPSPAWLRGCEVLKRHDCATVPACQAPHTARRAHAHSAPSWSGAQHRLQCGT